MPTVSIVIPTYNRAHLIERAVRSVIYQTYQDFEIIIVDDGSDDDTEKEIKKLSDSRLRYIRHDTNKGAAAARNTGIKASRGKYIAFQDSDDVWVEDKMEKQMKAFETAPPEVGVIYTGSWRMKHMKKIYTPPPLIKQKDGDIHHLLLRKSFVSTPTAVVKRACFDAVGMFDEELPRFQDWDLFLRISRHYHFKCIDEPLVIKYPQPDSITADSSKIIPAWEIIFKKHFADVAKDRDLLAYQHMRIGYAFASNGDLKQGRKYFAKAVAINPFSIEVVSNFAVSLLGFGIYDRVKKYYLKMKLH